MEYMDSMDASVHSRLPSDHEKALEYPCHITANLAAEEDEEFTAA